MPWWVGMEMHKVSTRRIDRQSVSLAKVDRMELLSKHAGFSTIAHATWITLARVKEYVCLCSMLNPQTSVSA